MRGISVIIPAYNRQQFIAQAINSVLDQEYNGFVEIIVSDDGSSDRTLEIAESFGNRVIILRKPEGSVSQGASAARNRGIRICTQPYICFLDSDDFFLPGHLKKISAAIELNENLGFAFCRIYEIDEAKDPTIYKPWTRNKISKKHILYPVISGNNVVCTNVFIFKRDVFDKVGLFNETFRNGEDGDMWMRISEQYQGTFSDHYCGVRRKHAFYQLTSHTKKTIYKNYVIVFSEATKRYYQLGLNDFYRISRLRFLVFKYKFISGLFNSMAIEKSFNFFLQLKNGCKLIKS